MSTYNYETVLSMLSARSRVLDWSGEKERIKELCAYAAVMSANDSYWNIVEDEEVQFSNGMLQMDGDTARIVRIRSLNGERIRHKAKGTTAQILDYNNGTVLVDSWKIPYDGEGLPHMNMWQLEYACAVCEYFLIRDAVYENKLTISFMEMAEIKMKKALKVATKFRPSVDDMEKAAIMMRCGIFFPNADILRASR